MLKQIAERLARDIAFACWQDWMKPGTVFLVKRELTGRVAEALLDFRAQARREALEEAAKVVEDEDGWEWAWLDVSAHDSYADTVKSLENIAARLRALVAEAGEEK